MPSPTLITLAEADALLVDVSPWSGTTDSDKTDALGWAEVYFNSTYVCPNEDLTDADSIDSSIKEGLSILANEHLQLSLFDRQSKEPAIKRSRKKVDTLEKEVEYAISNVGNKWVDYFPQVTALIGVVCYTDKASSIKTIPLLRR